MRVGPEFGRARPGEPGEECCDCAAVRRGPLSGACDGAGPEPVFGLGPEPELCLGVRRLCGAGGRGVPSPWCGGAPVFA